MSDNRKRKLSLLEILVIMAIVGILLSILGGRKAPVRPQQRPVTTAPSAPQVDSSKGNPYFWRP